MKISKEALSAMDRIVPRSVWPARLRAGAAFVLLAALAALTWWVMPHGLQVSARELQIARVERGLLRDELLTRALAEPLHSIALDSVEAGRVEEVLVSDGAMLAKGQLLFRLSNPQRHLELLARQGEHAQQLFNLALQRTALESSRSEHQRRLAELEFALAQADKQAVRSARLMEQGFIAAASFDEAQDKQGRARRAVRDEQDNFATEQRVKREAVQAMEGAVRGLESGLSLVRAGVEALAVRAPVAGRLTGFHLNVGETVRPDQHFGSIDDPASSKLVASMEEHFLARFAVGLRAQARLGEQDMAVTVSAVFPQVKEGRFSFELTFLDPAPPLARGQAVDTRITLGAARQAVLLPAGAFASEGTFAYVLDASGTRAERRSIVLGRRSHGQVEIVSGLAAGEQVIVSGYTAFGTAARLHIQP